MRILSVGSAGNASAAFDRRTDFEPGRVDTPADAYEILDGDGSIVLLPIAGPKDLSLDWIERLSERGGRVVVLSFVESSQIRESALKRGARDVIFPPIDPEAVETAVMGLDSRPGRRFARFAIDLAVFVTFGSERIEARGRNISRGGIKVDTVGTFVVPVGSVVQLEVQLGGLQKFPSVFAQVVNTGTSREGGRLHMRFVGLTASEQKSLDGLLDTLEPRLEDPETVLQRIEELTVAFFRKRDRRGLGVRVPQLTPIETRALAAPEGTPDAGLAEVTLARCRATMIAALIDEHPKVALDPNAPPLRFKAWKDEIGRARDRVSAEITSNLAGDPARLRELRDLRSRTNAASDHLERIAANYATTTTRIPTSGAGLQERAEQVTFEKPRAEAAPVSKSSSVAPPAEPGRTGRWRLVVGLVVLMILGGAAGAAWQSSWERHHAPVEREAVAASPVAVSHGVRVRNFFHSEDGVVAIVDGSWYQVSASDRASAAADFAQKQARGAQLKINDYKGAPVATVGSDGRIVLAATSLGGR